MIKKSTWTAVFAGGFDQEHGRFQGDGKYTWACGRSFVGSFKAGVTHGYGEMRFPKVSCAPYRGIRARRMEELHLKGLSHEIDLKNLGLYSSVNVCLNFLMRQSL